MKVRPLIFALLCLATGHIGAQEPYQMKGNDSKIEADFLFSYYQQDGDHAAVTGGIGTEQLHDIAGLLVVNIPIDTFHALNISLGVDQYSSASTDRIDNHMSSASSGDMRTYANALFTRKNLSKGETYGIGLGFSTEFDYTSFSTRLSYTKEWNEGNSEISLSGQAFLDRWDLIYPIELRNQVSLPTANRQSFNAQAVYSQVLSQRLQLALSGELIYMRGLLYTPFHRVYFQEGAGLDIERLPDHRLKIPLAIRLNYFPFDGLIVRSYYRYYRDDFGITAHTAEIELPVKLGPVFTVYPFYRYHTQTAADYFAPYGEHTSAETFYTSDYDLSALQSHKFGLGLKYAPPYGLARAKVAKGNKLFLLKYLALRSAYYRRSTGLKAVLFSLDLGMSIE